MRIHRPESGFIEASGTSRGESHGQGCVLGKKEVSTQNIWVLTTADISCNIFYSNNLRPQNNCEVTVRRFMIPFLKTWLHILVPCYVKYNSFSLNYLEISLRKILKIKEIVRKKAKRTFTTPSETLKLLFIFRGRGMSVKLIKSLPKWERILVSFSRGRINIYTNNCFSKKNSKIQ